jgi:hypothetical protein
LGTRSARLLASSALLLALACSDTTPSSPPFTDRFYYPTGLAIRHEPPGCLGGDGCQTQLLVASSNFDLRFDSATGGTVMDVAAAIQQPLQPLLPGAGGAQLGLARIGSFAGELAILDESSCAGWQTTLGNSPQALVASRSQNALYRLTIDTTGQLTCGEGCVVPLEGTFGDPYGVTVACGDFGKLAFVTYLRTPNSEGQLSQIDLTNNARTQRDLGSISPAHGTVFDPISTRLFVTERFGVVGSSPLRWFSLAATEATSKTDIYSLIRGAEVRGMALSTDGDATTSTPPSRGYLAVRIYDADVATSTGVRPSADVGGALAVMDLTQDPSGQPAMRLLNVVPIDRGASEIRIVPRLDPATGLQKVVAGTRLRDLVAVTCTDDNTLTLYDDDTGPVSGAVSKVFDICGGIPGQLEPPPCPLGDPLTGKQPFGLAVEALANGHARLYVGSFDRSWVNVIEIDPLKPADEPISWVRIGPERQ